MKKDTVTSNSENQKKIQTNPLHKPEIPQDSERGFPLLRLSHEYFSMDDLILKKDLKKRIEYIIEENAHAEKLHAIGMKPKQKILFCGPPGTGKTLTAKVMSSMIGYQFVYVLFDSIISSFLGETATNLRKIFSFIEDGKYVVLFDEFDIVGKKRDDPNEHGEVKRVVNNFMQMLDYYNGESILIAATNHQHLLDTAIWRRFDDILYFDLPDDEQRKDLFKKYLSLVKTTGDHNVTLLVNATKKYSAADISQICQDSIRKSVIDDRDFVTWDDLEWSLHEQHRRKIAMNQAT